MQGCMHNNQKEEHMALLTPPPPMSDPTGEDNEMSDIMYSKYLDNPVALSTRTHPW